MPDRRFDAVFKQLLDAEVRCAEQLKLRRHVIVNGKAVYGGDETRKIVAKEPQGTLIV